MRYLNIVLMIVFLAALITFCVNNTQEFTLTILGYRLMMPLQLWILMAAFFVAGMAPIIVLEIPSQATRFLRMRAMRTQIRELEKALARTSGSTGKPGKEVSEKP